MGKITAPIPRKIDLTWKATQSNRKFSAVFVSPLETERDRTLGCWGFHCLLTVCCTSLRRPLSPGSEPGWPTYGPRTELPLKILWSPCLHLSSAVTELLHWADSCRTGCKPACGTARPPGCPQSSALASFRPQSSFAPARPCNQHKLSVSKWLSLVNEGRIPWGPNGNDNQWVT